MSQDIANITAAARPVFQKYGVRKAGVFGSRARGSARPDSDVDILIELKEPIGVFALARMRRELVNSVGYDVDLVTRDSVISYFIPSINDDLVLVYEE